MIKETAEKIRSVEIQGATNIAVAALEAVRDYSKGQDTKSIHKGIDVLKETRPTEPLMMNTLGILKKLDSPKAIEKRAGELLDIIKTGMGNLVEIGSRLIKNGMIVQTICHSSTVTKILIKAKQEGRDFKVVVTETRPLYQGRKTAKELHEAGIPVTMYVDSGMYLAMKKDDVDIVLVGIDAIFTDGSIANKIGTGILALAAESLEVPVYGAGLAMKLDMGSLMAEGVTIEKRDPKEIWAYPVDVINPAFEIVPVKRIKGIITELGVLPPATAYLEIERHYNL